METEVKEETKRVPYAERLADALAIQKEMLVLLQGRVSMNNLKIDGFNATHGAGSALSGTTSESKPTPTWQALWDVNEAKISNIKTKGEIDVLKRVIYEKETYYNNFLKQHELDLEEVKKRWDITIKVAKTSANPNVQKLMKNIRWDVVEHDEEVKIGAYKALKKYI